MFFGKITFENCMTILHCLSFVCQIPKMTCKYLFVWLQCTSPSLSRCMTYTPSIWSPCSGWKTSPCLQHHTTTSCYFAAVGEGRAFSNHHQMHDWCIKCNSWCIKFKGVLFTYRTTESYNAYPQFTSITQQVVGTEPVTCSTVFDA